MHLIHDENGNPCPHSHDHEHPHTHTYEHTHAHSHEHGHEGVAGQQIYAALALGYAVEEQDEAETEPCKHLQTVGLAYALHQACIAKLFPR